MLWAEIRKIMFTHVNPSFTWYFWYFILCPSWYLNEPILVSHYMPILVSHWPHSGTSLSSFWYLTVCPFWYFIEPILVAHWAHSGILGNRVPLMLLLGTYAAMQITMLFEESQWNRNCNNRHNDSEDYKMYWHQQCRKSVRKLFTWIPMFLSMIN